MIYTKIAVPAMRGLVQQCAAPDVRGWPAYANRLRQGYAGQEASAW